MITRSLAYLVIGFWTLDSISAFGQVSSAPNGAPAPLLPPAPLAGRVGSPGVKTNRTQLFSSAPIQPRFVPPTLGLPPGPRVLPQPVATAGFGRPAPLADPPRPVAPPPTVSLPKPPTQPANYIVWDAESKEYNAKPGEASAHFTFYVTNVSKEVVLVNSVHTSCGCTVAQLPEQPWHLQPGSNGPINVTVNLAGKSGTIVKSVTVDTSAGVKSLLVKVNIPSAQPVASGVDVDRMRNMQVALADRQAVFKG